MDAGLLAVKRLDAAKSRLASRFSDQDRLSIARALFDDALELCRGTTHLRWWIVSDDQDVVDQARGRGFETMKDTGSGLNDAITTSARALTEMGASSVTVLPCDIPLATPEDLLDIADTGELSDIVVVPSEGDGGTNALYLRPPEVITPLFGPGSLTRHIRAAERAGLRCSVLPLERLELDLDTPADIDTFLRADPPTTLKTAELLRKLTA
ncbi:MAG: 2-phospho-L-lactate guanylyltransferase [Actinobacteria bacterium]|nr:2-phospho-L-lactate guanylyltransferase [Actinomycetota bacterium]